MTIPCKCGHPVHVARACECGCARTCPDYAAGAKAAGREPTKRERKATREMVQQTRWRNPKNAHTLRPCAFCDRAFTPTRKDNHLCSGDCQSRTARVKARAEEPLGPLYRDDCFSKERAYATGNGLLTRDEAYAAEMRVWRAHHQGATHEAV